MRVNISITIDENVLNQIDKLRGDVPRSTWINREMKEVVEAHDLQQPN